MTSYTSYLSSLSKDNKEAHKMIEAVMATIKDKVSGGQIIVDNIINDRCLNMTDYESFFSPFTEKGDININEAEVINILRIQFRQMKGKGVESNIDCIISRCVTLKQLQGMLNISSQEPNSPGQDTIDMRIRKKNDADAEFSEEILNNLSKIKNSHTYDYINESKDEILNGLISSSKIMFSKLIWFTFNEKEPQKYAFENINCSILVSYRLALCDNIESAKRSYFLLQIDTEKLENKKIKQDGRKFTKPTALDGAFNKFFKINDDISENFGRTAPEHTGLTLPGCCVNNLENHQNMPEVVLWLDDHILELDILNIEFKLIGSNNECSY
jgi:hypothetical protein